MTDATQSPPTATPIALLEAHFGQRLARSTLRWFDAVSEDGWVDFAKQYLATMQRRFAEEFLRPTQARPAALRFYFEPRLRDAWDRSVAARHPPTPLLGLDPRPPALETPQAVSRLLEPLKKHLLLADAVYIRDSFYYCFDAVADTVQRQRWRRDPNTAALVREGIRALKGWLPILVELRPFIESGALVFMPYYLTPSFPYDAGAPALEAYFRRLRIRPDPAGAAKPALALDLNAALEAMRRAPRPASPAAPWFSESEAITAWLNGRILGLDPVFPHRPMADYAARLYFDDGPRTADACSDLLSLQVLPFGDAAGIDLDTLWALRKNEEVFSAVQRIVADCKEYIRANLGEGSSRAAVSDACETFLRDHLDRFERNSNLRFLKYADERPAVGFALSVAIGAALLPASPAVAAIAAFTTPFLTPATARAIQNRLSPERRAYGYLQALL